MKYRKKPVVVDAIQYRGTYTDEIKEFFGGALHEFDGSLGIKIPTLEGVFLTNQFDWIIKGVKGEFYPCNPDIFEATYEPVDEDISLPEDYWETAQ
jgi:hypothetical protein